MPDIPRDPSLDSTFALLREGYRFIGSRCDSLGSDISATRLMLRRAICMRGESAAGLFYGSGSFTRRGAMPPTTVRLLQDFGSVQMLDGERHRHRKATFVRLLTDQQEIDRIGSLFRLELLGAIDEWRQNGAVVLMDAMPVVLSPAPP